MVQKSDALLVTNASLCFVPAPAPAFEFVGAAGWHPDRTKLSINVQTTAEIKRAHFSGRIGFLGKFLIGLIFLAHSAGLEKLRQRRICGAFRVLPGY
jgi:hypothetical protein